MSTSETAPRVAVLARPGAACDRIRQALDAIGADVVLVGDPAELAPESLRDASARAVVIALEPAVENALDRFEVLLDTPELLVLFEEADLAARREGWDVARWQRHLAAKLFGHGDVLPPMPEGGAEAIADAGELEAAFDAAAGFANPVTEGMRGIAHDAPDAEAALPVDGLGMEALPEASEAALETEFAFAAATTAAADGAAPLFDPVAAEYAEFDDASVRFDLDAGLPEVDLAGQDFAVELDTRTLAADNAAVVDLTFDAPLDAPSEIAPVALEPDQDDAAAADETGLRQMRLNVELAELERRIAGLSLVDEHVPAEDNGAVVVLAGIGGPDAVRQLLGALPAGFPRPVLVRQRLDGGRYDKLVAQMQRVSAMPVKLAEPGMPIEPGTVYIAPPELGLQGNGRRVFAADAGDLIAALPAADSALLMLSGSDPALVDSALAAKAAGALVYGQALDGCFDTAAIDALIARGGETGTPAELAARLVDRWRQRATFGDLS